ncbi:NADH-ubiquinone/plastoquinone complex I subunit [Bordetella bronchiseptica MBORD675]|uniref:monovalent cation/H+ antiporter subunit D n=1 Tax=Bordetella bronchiseptica TaxID=518 RepID=UPI0002905FBE|nr:monovalent cation/H+ antiporter subunit D [Bordetella bronchiseptica]AUL15341.1 monovalent cation/H+ antiporter subunit D [Bordetella bronchiseptica]AWP58438.1 monovalent cation/H+ antiporter subunit D [Bordetella bronchiseptica]AZW30737.1 monovalent cation/H+ antiporter subunit D [Bordetella bronchiseptica]KAK69679.1 NADH-ubiquinone/plastoquinone complex I subunit [Bordetella bronchiseptica CA90 BB02]KCV41480.1 NADH-ubiquinone/plastoquinone complex I subunit [Bordetella bronchiseptica 345]
MIDWLQHLPIYPITVPLIAGALMLLLPDTQRKTRAGIGLLSSLLQLASAIALLSLAAGAGGIWPDGIGVYLPGDWPAPFGIVLVVDRLAAVMLALTAVLGLAALIYSLARWDRAGVHFHSLYQFLLMGLNGAFLTGDLFNLFVFFEVLLAASYGLMLHGSGIARVTAGLQYIAVNLVASFLLLISIALIYGVTGTLNLADLALRAGTLTGGERSLFEAGAAILGVAFLVKAGAWPLNFWLVKGYGSAAAPVAALFSIMTKVGIYALLRIGSLLLPTGAPAAFSLDWMFAAGLATLVFGGLGLLANQQLEKLTGYCVIVSAGTLLTALGMPGVTLTGPALFYLISSVLATGALFMLVELIERTRSFGANVLAVTMDLFDLDDPSTPNRSDDVVGVAIPAAMAFLGLAFVSCALLVTGLPPLSGFVAKFSLLSAAVTAANTPSVALDAWVLVALVLLSGLAGLIALGRVGIRIFWSSDDRVTPRLRLMEAGPVAVLLLLCVVLAAGAGPVSAYLDAAAQSLDRPATYVNAVLAKQPARALSEGL